MKSFVVILSLLLFIGCESEEMLQPEPNQSIHADQWTKKEQNARGTAFPDLIPLPNGFAPEGIASGSGTDFFVGSLADGSIYKGDYRDGSGSVLISGTVGQLSVGLDYDERTKYLFVAGGPTPSKVYNGSTGQEIASLTFPGSGFVNDVIVTRDAAYFTDSFLPVIYAVSLNRDGSLDTPAEFQSISLTGDFVFVPGAFNANGIVATPNEKQLIIVNGSVGELYLIEPSTGNADQIDLMGASVSSGDGLVLAGNELFVVQNFLNQIAVISLDSDYSSGEITNIITDPAFRIPTTAAEFGSSIYAVNARFDVAPPGGDATNIEFEVVRVDRK